MHAVCMLWFLYGCAGLPVPGCRRLFSSRSCFGMAMLTALAHVLLLVWLCLLAIAWVEFATAYVFLYWLSGFFVLGRLWKASCSISAA